MPSTSEDRLNELADNIPAENTSTDRTPEDLLAEDAGEFAEAQELNDVSVDDLVAAEDRASMSDANDDADAREAEIETNNDTMDSLVADSQEVSDEGIDDSGHQRD